MNSIIYNNAAITPSKVVCIGRNYAQHIQELGNETPDTMVIFNKTNSAISKELKYFDKNTRFEGEMCFIVENSKIVGVGFGLDLTHAITQNTLKTKGLPWERAKSFDGSCVLGEFVKLIDKIEELRFELWINDTLVQFADYHLMIHKPYAILEEIEEFMTLEDGDIIMSGTPKGVGNYCKGDVFIGKIFCKDALLVQSKWQAM